MANKISDRPIRDKKIKRLKAKILAEIDREMSIIKNEIKIYLEDNEYFDSLIKRSFALLHLKEYIEREYTFQHIQAEYPDIDAVVYVVSDRSIDIWLQEDYSFVFNFLCRVKDCDYDVFYILNDHYFEYNFITVFDRIVYDSKKKEQDEIERNKKKPHHCMCCGKYIEEERLRVCDKCASEFKF